jgi:hypothetical protein
MSIGGYPELNTETGEYSMPPLDEHMDAYFHQVHDFAPTEAFDPSLSPSPEPQVISSPVQPASPVAVPSPAPSPVRAAPSSFPHTARQQYQQLRPQIGQLDPMQFRQLLEQSGRRRPMPMSDAPLSPMEAAAQRLMADPQQSLLSEYYKSMDKAMDDVMQIVKGGRR